MSRHNQLPATSYQLPATSYQLPATSYQLPATSYEYCFVKNTLDIHDKLSQFTQYFPDLTQRVHDLKDYSGKLALNARVLCLDTGGQCIGFSAYYANDAITFTGYITLIAIHEDFRCRGLGGNLLTRSLEDMKALGMKKARLEVRKSNLTAISFYEANGFIMSSEAGPESQYMLREL